MFLAVVTSATEVGNTRPSAPVPEIVSQIHDVGFFCLTSSTWDDLTLAADPLASAGGYSDSADTYMRDYTNSGTTTPAPEHPCAALRKIISGGTFYYAMEPQWDISSRLQHRLARHEPWDASTYDDRFVWNEFIVRSLLDFRERLEPRERVDLDQCQFIVRSNHNGISLLVLIFGWHCIGSRHPRICRREHTRSPGPSHQRDSHHCDDFPHFSAGMETCGDPIQHARCG